MIFGANVLGSLYFWCNIFFPQLDFRACIYLQNGRIWLFFSEALNYNPLGRYKGNRVWWIIFIYICIHVFFRYNILFLLLYLFTFTFFLALYICCVIFSLCTVCSIHLPHLVNKLECYCYIMYTCCCFRSLRICLLKLSNILYIFNSSHFKEKNWFIFVWKKSNYCKGTLTRHYRVCWTVK